MLDIIKYPNPQLREENKAVINPTDPQIKKLVAEMVDTLRSQEGVGLAAPQVGVNLRVCVIEIEHELFVLINPEIRKYYGEEIVLEEGCLSFPGKFLPVKRFEKIKVKAVDANGKKQIIRAKGLLSRALQHEIDHLNGELFIDKAEPEKKFDK